MHTKTATLDILKRRPKRGWYPHEIREELARRGIYISDSSVERSMRRYAEVYAKPPVREGVRAWTYHLREKCK